MQLWRGVEPWTNASKIYSMSVVAMNTFHIRIKFSWKLIQIGKNDYSSTTMKAMKFLAPVWMEKFWAEVDSGGRF